MLFRSDALKAAGLSDTDLLEYGNYSAESGFVAMRKLLKRRRRPTALFAGNDTIAMGAMVAIHQYGLRIPEDIAVVGYDNIPTAPFMVPPLTTIHVSALEHGFEAMKSLNGLLQGERPSVLVKTLETPLVIRESCGATAPKD